MRHAVVVFVVLCVGVAVWWSTRVDPATELSLGDAGNSPSTVAEATAAPQAETTGAAGALQRVAAAATELADQGPAVATARVRVVDAATRAPVPAAEVIWYDQLFDWGRLTAAEREAQVRDPEEFFRQRGKTAVADAEGRVVLRPRGWASLIGRKGELYGTGQWKPQVPADTTGPFAGEFVLQLRPDRTLLVRTVDESQKPVAGVVVQVVTTHGPDAQGRRSGRELPASGADGLTQLKHAQLLFLPERNVETAFLSARLTGANGLPVAIDPAALPEGPVAVVVPPFGSVLVELLGPDGASWSLPEKSDHTVMLMRARSIGGTAVQGVEGVMRETFDVKGRAMFARVRCGLRFELTGPNGWQRGAEFDGPVRAGEQVRATLRLSADVSLLAGRVLGEDGAPFAGGMEVQFEGQGGSSSNGLPLDSDGRFLVPVPDWVGRTPSVALREQGPFESTRRVAEVVLRGALVPGRNDLGDLVLRAPPLLVAGQVVVTGGAEAASILGDVFVELERCTPGERERWQQANEFGGHLDAEGRFEVRGHPQGQKFRILVRGNCAPQPPREFGPGTTNLRLEVAAGGTVSATFLETPSWQRLSYRLLLAGAVDAKATSEWQQQDRERGHPGKDGERIAVGWLGLAAGAYRLLVGCPGQTPIVDLLVHVPASGAASDPRLRDIDLGGRVRTVVVRVTDAAGKPFAGEATLALRGLAEAGASWHGQRFNERSGGGERFDLSEPADLLVVAEGHRGVVVPGVFADTTVMLVPAPKATLQWVDAPALPDGVTVGLAWTVAGWPSSGPLLTVVRGGDSTTSSADGLLALQRLPRELTAGRADVVWEAPFPVEVRAILRQKGKRPQFVPHAPTVLDAALLVDGQTIELRTEPAAVQAALDKLAGK